MAKGFRAGHWVTLSAICIASCSQGDANRITGPSNAGVVTRTTGANGTVGSSAVGDVKVGTGALEIEALRMDRQTSSGVSIYRQYAEAGRSYRMEVGETIELWAEWDRNEGKVPTIIPNNPRFYVDWGEGEINRFDWINCGSCLMKHTYPRSGRYTVTVTLDDRATTTVSRTFILDSTDSRIVCGAPGSTQLLIDTSPESDSINAPVRATSGASDFDDADSGPLAPGPVLNANRLSFACTTNNNDELRAQSVGEVHSSDESGNGCYAHSHGGSLNVFVEVHNPDTNGWTRIFTQPLTGSSNNTLDEAPEVFSFTGRSFSFERQKVDKIRLLSDPGQGNTFHSWGGVTMTVSCNP